VLFAVRFDVRKVQVVGDPVPVIEGVRTDISTSHYAVAANGTLAYIPGRVLSGVRQQVLGLFDRNGAVERLNVPIAAYEAPRISPDGRSIAVGIDDGRDQNVWIYPVGAGASMRRLTFGGHNRLPVWSPDGRRVAFQSDRDQFAALYVQSADGNGQVERLTTPAQGEEHIPDSWSPDGTQLLYEISKPPTTALHVYSLRTRESVQFDAVVSDDPINAVFSPDGRWIAYQSTEARPMQVFVQSFPATGAKFQLTRTTSSSHYPLWSRDGKELVFIPGRALFAAMRVTNTSPSFTVGDATPLPRSAFFEGGPAYVRSYDLAPDGRILAPLFNGAAIDAMSSNLRMQVVTNWVTELNDRFNRR
jgi:dipeptidyl aminopeptidase/acylaminoacyl peptidase